MGCEECGHRGWIYCEYGGYEMPESAAAVQRCDECADPEEFDDVNAAELACEYFSRIGLVQWFIGWHGTGTIEGEGYAMAAGGDVWITPRAQDSGAHSVDSGDES